MEQNHKKCRRNVLNKIGKISYLIYEIKCIDCPESKTDSIKDDLDILGHNLDELRRKYQILH